MSAVEVRAQGENLEGLAIAGSEGVVSGQRLAAVPSQRPGEALEMVPGLIVTQHAVDGKANQYFSTSITEPISRLGSPAFPSTC